MNTKSLFSECLANVPKDISIEIDLSFDIAARIEALLVQKGISQKDFALMLGKRESEISKWLKGSHNFTLRTIAKISCALNESIIQVAPIREREYSMDVKLSLIISPRQNKMKEISSSSYSNTYNIVNLNKNRYRYDC